jgi:hypothetical protein
LDAFSLNYFFRDILKQMEKLNQEPVKWEKDDDPTKHDFSCFTHICKIFLQFCEKWILPIIYVSVKCAAYLEMCPCPYELCTEAAPRRTGHHLKPGFWWWPFKVSFIRTRFLCTRVARWFVFKPKIPIWVNFGGPWNGKGWYILWLFWIYYSHLVI